MRNPSRRDLLAAVPLLAGWSGLRRVSGFSGTAGIPAHEALRATETVGAADRPLVILGASYAAGWQLPLIAGRTVVNKGLPGQESWELLKRFDKDVIALQPEALILWGYINDIFRSPRAAIDSATARVRESVEVMVSRARGAGIEAIVATELTIRLPSSWSETISSWAGWVMGKESYQSYVNGHVTQLNDWLRELARREGLLVLDLNGVLADSSGQRARGLASEDGSHISAEGYARLTEYAVPLLEAHLRRTRP